MEIFPQQVTNESPARSVVAMDHLDMAAPRGAPNPFESADVVEAFDFTGSLTFPIETLIP